MTGDAGYVTDDDNQTNAHNPNHAFIMKKALADVVSGEEGDKYCRLQSTPEDKNASSGKWGKKLIKADVKCHIPSVSVLGKMSDFDLYLLHESLDFIFA